MTTKTTNTQKGKFNFGDSLGLLSLLIGMLLVVVTLPLMVKVFLLLVIFVGCYVFMQRSHWTHSWGRWRQNGAATVIVVLLLRLGIPQFFSQWKTEHPAQLQKPTPTPPIVAPTLAVTPSQITFQTAAPVMPSETYRFRLSNTSDKDVYLAEYDFTVGDPSISDRDFRIDIPMESRKAFGGFEAVPLLDMLGLLCKDKSQLRIPDDADQHSGLIAITIPG
jgi:hypothetical protein